MAIMQKYYGALEPAMLRRVHAAVWRPRAAGGMDASADSVAPAISRVYFRSLVLRLSLPLLWLMGATCAFAVGFDRFEAGSTPEWVACAVAALMLPVNVCNGASLNARTVRGLLTEFQTLYVIVNILGFMCLGLFLFRGEPAKMVAFGLGFPSFLLTGLQDAYVEGGRVLNSRLFFTVNIGCFLVFLALVSFKLGTFTDYTFELSTFAFVASSMVCSTITTLLVFGFKNLSLSFYRPGSLVVLASAVCCLFLDVDTLAVMKAVYSLQGQTLGKFKPNTSVQRQLKMHGTSIVAMLAAAANAVAPAPAAMQANETLGADTPQPAASFPLMVEHLGDGSAADFEHGSGAAGAGCARFDMRRGAGLRVGLGPETPEPLVETQPGR
jgi:hypothetical protein